MKELNPNNRALSQVRAHWHKIAAVVMVKLGTRKLELKVEDFQRLAGNNLVLDCRKVDGKDSMILRLVDDAEALRLANQEGGMPWQS